MNSCFGVFVSDLYESTVSDIGGVGQAGNGSMNERGYRFKNLRSKAKIDYFSLKVQKGFSVVQTGIFLIL